MQVAQKLYEGVELEDHSEGLITYMRTDSTRLSNVFIEAAHDFIVGHFGKEYWVSTRLKMMKIHRTRMKRSVRQIWKMSRTR